MRERERIKNFFFLHSPSNEVASAPAAPPHSGLAFERTKGSGGGNKGGGEKEEEEREAGGYRGAPPLQCRRRPRERERERAVSVGKERRQYLLLVDIHRSIAKTSSSSIHPSRYYTSSVGLHAHSGKACEWCCQGGRQSFFLFGKTDSAYIRRRRKRYLFSFSLFGKVRCVRCPRGIGSKASEFLIRSFVWCGGFSPPPSSECRLVYLCVRRKHVQRVCAAIRNPCGNLMP